MFPWLSALTAAFGLAREIVKYLRDKEQCNKAVASDVKRLRAAIKKGDTSEIESIFKSVSLESRD